MSQTIERVTQIFHESASSIMDAAVPLAPLIAKGAQMITDALRHDRKVMICGNGGSAADAQHFASEMLNRFEMERPGLPAISLCTDTSTLTSIANDFQYSQIYSKQVQALGQVGDILVPISTSGHSSNILEAVNAARMREMHVVALNGRDGGALSELMQSSDADIVVPGTSTARIQEIHGIIIHCLCDLIDHKLLLNYSD